MLLLHRIRAGSRGVFGSIDAMAKDSPDRDEGATRSGDTASHQWKSVARIARARRNVLLDDPTRSKAAREGLREHTVPRA